MKELLRGDPALARAKDENGFSALMIAAYAGASGIARALEDAGAPVSVFEAAALGRLDVVRDLVSITPGLLRTFSHDGWTLLHLAVFFGHTPLSGFLIGHGADLDAVSRNPMANTPLHSAVAGRRIAASKLLLEAGAAVNAQAQNLTPLHLAAHAGHGQLVELLLAFGADTKVRDAQGHTAAALATDQGHSVIADYIRKY